MKRVLKVLLVLILTVSMMGIHVNSSDNTVRAADDDKLTVVINNILNANFANVNGHAVACEKTFTMIKGQSKTMTGSGAFSYVGGANITAIGLGYSYKFLKAFVESTADGTVVTAAAASDLITITKIQYTSTGNIVLTYSDGNQKTISDTNTLYISPVYSVTASWYLNYHYVDNISNASSAWSNQDFVNSYKHTFKNPSPVSHYQFVYWKDTDSGLTYVAEDELTYSTSELPSGQTKDIYVYATYQPSVTVRYHYQGNLYGEEKEAFENINICTDYTFDHQGLEFTGWFDAEGNKISDSEVAVIPALTTEPVERKIVDAYAHYKVTITPQDNGKIYGDPEPELEAKVTGLAEDDSCSYELKRESGEDIGKYEIFVAGGFTATTYPSNTKRSNPEKYDIYTETAEFTIVPKEVTVTAQDNGKVYGDKDPDLEAVIDGLVEGESADLIKYSLEREEGESVGEYAISTKGEEAQGNYTVKFNDAVFNITPKEVTVTAQDDGKVQGDEDPELKAVIEGLVEGDSEDLIKYSLEREEGEEPGDYIITPSGEEAQGNYTVVFVEGTFNITPKVPETADNGLSAWICLMMFSFYSFVAMIMLKRNQARE